MSKVQSNHIPEGTQYIHIEDNGNVRYFKEMFWTNRAIKRAEQKSMKYATREQKQDLKVKHLSEQYIVEQARELYLSRTGN